MCKLSRPACVTILWRDVKMEESLGEEGLQRERMGRRWVQRAPMMALTWLLKFAGRESFIWVWSCEVREAWTAVT
jgi:hypothetical protein